MKSIFYLKPQDTHFEKANKYFQTFISYSGILIMFSILEIINVMLVQVDKLYQFSAQSAK